MEPLKLVGLPNKKEVRINLVPYRSLDAALGKEGVNEDNLVRIFSHIKSLHKNNPTVSTSFKNNVSYLGNGVEESRLDHTITKKGGGNGTYQIDDTDGNKYRWSDYNDFIIKNGNTPESQTDFIIGEANDEILHLTKPDKNGKQTVTITNWTPWADKKGKPLRGQIAKSIFMDPNSSITDKTKALGEYILRPKSNISLDRRAKYSNVIAFLFRDYKYKSGGKFTPKKSQLVKNAEELNSKRDMRKKLVRGTNWPSIKKRIVKKQQGGILDDEFLNYNNVSISETPLPELTFNTFSFNPYNYISEEPSKREVPNQSSEEISQEPNIQKEEKPILEKTVKSPDFDPKLGLMGEFVKIATEEGIPFRVTSGYRPNSITSNGSRSWHSKGLALDIIPKEGVSWEVFKNSFNKAPKTLKWIRDNKMGILDETTPEMLARTGGTGAHWHIGRDKMAVDSFSKMFPISKNGGVLKAQWGTKLTGVYTVNPGDNLTKISNSLEIPQDSLLSYNNIPKSKANDLTIGQELLWRKEPEFLDNVKRFFFEPKEESDKSVSRNDKIEKNVQLSKTTKPEVNPIYSTRFKEKNFRKFANTMKTIYSEVLDELGLPKHNISNLVRQDALESTYGTSPRGNGYNLGGIKVFNNKETLGTRHSDGYYYRNFKDLKDYARYKIKLLHNDYGAIEAPSEQFIDALHGKNKKKKVYSAGKDAYEKFRNMKSLNKYLDESN